MDKKSKKESPKKIRVIEERMATSYEEDDFEEPMGAAAVIPRREEMPIDILIIELLDVNINHLELSLNDIVFQGFHPRDFLLTTQRLADAAQIIRQTHKKNLVLLGLVCALRGNKINKIIQSPGSSKRLKDALNSLRGIYSIIDGKPTSPTSCTLPRFLAVTAIPVSLIIYQGGGNQITLPLTPEVTPGNPFVFCISHAGALLPAGSTTYDTLSKAVAYGQYLMTLEFGGKSTKHQVLQFVNIVAKSNLWTNEQKIAHLIKIGVLTGENTVSPFYNNPLKEVATKFDNLQ